MCQASKLQMSAEVFNNLLNVANKTVCEISRDFAIYPAAVYRWQMGIPVNRVLELCKYVGWRITPHEMCPRIYPHPDDGLPAELRNKN
jgi:hypothetical protein